MKRLSVILAPVLIMGLLCIAVAAAHVAATYNDTLKGFQTATSDSNGVAVVINAAGDLPGMGKVTFSREGNNINGGSWTLTVLPAQADASSSDRGTLSGTVTGGTLSFTPEGTLSGASSVQLTIGGGTGEHAAVSAGSGTINLSSDTESPSKLSGTLVLNF
ncbi:MAG TPA: hypothetical protein VGA87_08390 [Pyrinomonadaceae bacterium]|jgi:hypothetical protein